MGIPIEHQENVFKIRIPFEQILGVFYNADGGGPALAVHANFCTGDAIFCNQLMKIARFCFLALTNNQDPIFFTVVLLLSFQIFLAQTLRNAPPSHHLLESPVVQFR